MTTSSLVILLFISSTILQESEIVKEKVKQLTKFKEDYEALKARLETLPDKVSHEVMVPFGKLAFIPGRVKHTNEILCLLGDNWFVERSAKQSAQIVDRRIKGDSIIIQAPSIPSSFNLIKPAH